MIARQRKDRWRNSVVRAGCLQQISFHDQPNRTVAGFPSETPEEPPSTGVSAATSTTPPRNRPLGYSRAWRRWSGLGRLRDPSNTRRVLRETRGSEGFAWVTSRVFRKTAATILDEAGLTARLIANRLGHSRPPMTQDVHMGREAVSRDTAETLEAALGTGAE